MLTTEPAPALLRRDTSPGKAEKNREQNQLPDAGLPDPLPPRRALPSAPEAGG